MSGSSKDNLSEIVARFFERRRSGERVSIDDVLETADLTNPPSRTEVQRAIAEVSRAHLSGADTLGSTPSAGVDPASWDELPEIEGYDIIDVLGKGGMGMVYEAYQQSTGRRVAVKFMLGQAAASESGRRRFEREVELVARLQHPNIVSILDSGVHRRRWYYVMEYVDGRTLDDALVPGQCDVREALHLVALVCEAVDYAHQRGVLHRDLKPSNIIIDERGEPRLLDFGLAKAIDPDSKMGVDISLSEPGQIIGTLAFMPPEQSRGRYHELSVRTDVYSLGAVTYELVTGKLPCSMDDSLSEVLKRIEEVDPAPPSTIRPKVSRDVDAVLLKALEKSPSNRYASAREFADDLRRILNDEPVQARRAGVAIRATRWMRRNKLATTVGGASLALILIIVAVATVQIIMAVRARLDQTDLSEQTNAYLSETMSRLSPDEAYFRPAMTLLEQNDAHAQRLVDDPPARPEVAAKVHSVVGENYHRLKEFRKAEFHHRTALGILRNVHKKPHAEVAESLHNLAAALWQLGAYSDAEPLYREALTMRRGLFGEMSLEVADTTNHLAACMDRLERNAEAEALYRESLRIRKALLANHPEAQEPIAASLNNFGTFLRSRGQIDEAAEMFEESIQLIIEIRGQDDVRVATAKLNLAKCRIDQKRFDDADELLRSAHSIYLKRLGPDNNSIASSFFERARLYEARGSYAEAQRLCRQVLDLRRRHLPDDHDDITHAMSMAARLTLREGDAQGAVRQYREVLDRRLKENPVFPVRVASAKAALAAALFAAGDLSEATTAADDSLARFQDALQSATRRTIDVAAQMIDLLQAVGFNDAAANLQNLIRQESEEPLLSSNTQL